MAKQEKGNGGYDVAVIGGGPGGYVAAIRAAQLGLSTAIVEQRETYGGTCVNIGCIPSKALLDSSELYARIRHDAEQNGIIVGDVRLDIAKMMERKNRVVDQLTRGVGQLLSANGITTVRGTGRLLGGGKVDVTLADGGKTEIAAGHIILATGSVEARLPFLPFDGERIVSSTDALSFDEVPKRLLVVGGGVIGLELGSVWSRLGSEVTVIELMPQILPGSDGGTAKLLQRSLAKQGIAFHLSTGVSGFRIENEAVVLSAKDGQGKKIELAGEKVLVAVGRRPFSEGLGLAEAGVETEERGGRVKIDERFRTNVPGIYAIGDLVRGPMLAHKAEEEGIAAIELIAGGAGHVNYGTIPGVVYTWPEVATVGLTEEALQETGTPYRKGEFPFRANGRALAMDAPDGSVKILADERTDRVLGVHIVGPWASDLIQEAVSVMEFGGSAEDIARTVHAHPTLTEAVKEAALGVARRPIHTLSPKIR